MKLKTKWKIDYQNDEHNTFAQILYGLMKDWISLKLWMILKLNSKYT